MVGTSNLGRAGSDGPSRDQPDVDDQLAAEHGRAVPTGEVMSTGTCTGHCFASPGDVASADFGPLGRVEVSFT